VHKVFSVQDNGMTGFGMWMQSLGHSEKYKIQEGKKDCKLFSCEPYRTENILRKLQI
jgi:hypothetical protein